MSESSKLFENLEESDLDATIEAAQEFIDVDKKKTGQKKQRVVKSGNSKETKDRRMNNES